MGLRRVLLLLLAVCLVASARTGGQHDLRRELAEVKELLVRLERKLDSSGVVEFGRKLTTFESSLNSLVTKVSELNRKSQLLNEIHQDNDARNDILQRISRSVEELGRKKIKSVEKKTDVEMERLDKLSENVQALFQIFGGMNRKLDDLLTRMERMPPCLEKVDARVAATVTSCDRESLKEVLVSSVRHPLESHLAKTCSELERSVRRLVVEAEGGVGGRGRVSRLTAGPAPQDGGGGGGESPGRMFRKLWRRLTEPMERLAERMDTLSAATERHHNETLARLKSGDRQVRLVQNATRRIEAAMAGACGGGGGSIGVTEAYQEGPPEGYLAASCADLQRQGGTVRSGIYTLKPRDAPDAFLAFCDLDTDAGGWTVFQRRGDFGDEFRQNFTQNWEVYKRGFGDPQREFWIGNEKIFALTNQDDVKLRVELRDFDDNTAYAEYTRFKVDEEKKQYKLSVGGYQGNATDSLSLHDGKMFSTYDRDNDEVSSCCNCADTFKGGWWYYRCFEANLNGPYQTDPTDNGYFLGIIWEKWKGDYSLKSSEMKIRPLSFEEPVADP